MLRGKEAQGWARRPLLAFGGLVLLGGLLGGVLFYAIASVEISVGGSPSVMAAIPLLTLQDAFVAIQVVGLVAGLAAGWFVAHGPGTAGARALGALLSGSVGLAGFFLVSVPLVWLALAVTYPELDLESLGAWFRTTEFPVTLGVTALLGGLYGGLGAGVPLLDEHFARGAEGGPGPAEGNRAEA